MKITVNKDFTKISQAEQVKTDIKEFKGRYTDGDLKNAFCDATGIDCLYGAVVLSVTGEAFPGGTDYNDATHFSLEIVARKFNQFIVARFYCDMELQVDVRVLCGNVTMYSCDVYNKQ